MKINIQFIFNERKNVLVDVNSGFYTYDPEYGTRELLFKIRNREQRVLACLLQHEGRVVSREYIFAHAWQGRITTDNSLSVTVHNLRKCFMRVDPRSHCLVTLPKVGFVFSIMGSGFVVISSLDEIAKKQGGGD